MRNPELLFVLTLSALISPTATTHRGDVDDDEGPAAIAATADKGLRVDRGEGLALVIPEKETLEYAVILDVAVIGETAVGAFTLSAGTEPFHAGLPALGQDAEPVRQYGWIRGEAEGHYLRYTLDHSIETRILPQEWPHVIYRDTQTGSENRRRELFYGHKEGKATSWYRSDTHCKECSRREHFVEGTWPFTDDHHCKKCKRGEHRVWNKPSTREIPEHSVDMLSAIHLARMMVQAGRDEVEFPMVDKRRYWDVTLTRTKRKKLDVPAGKFWCRAIKMGAKLPPGEPEKEQKFKGLFGIHGTLNIWLEEETGVPVMIEGLVPLGPFDLDVSLQLESFKGTPEGFAPAK